MAHWLFLPDDALDDLVILSGLSSDQLNALRRYLDSNDFRPRYTFYTKVAELLNISDESAAKLCTFINHVHTQRSKLNRDAASIPAEIESFLSRAAKQSGKNETAGRLRELVKANRTAIIKLFSELPERDFSAKLRGLETGPLPHLHSFRTFCDARPVYDEDATEIVSQLPVLTLSLVTHCAASDKFEHVVVQLAESDLVAFRNAFDRLDKKLALLKKKQGLAQTTQADEEALS